MKIDLAVATKAEFAPFVGTTFTITVGDIQVPLELTEVHAFAGSTLRDIPVVIEGAEIPPRQAFGLTFTGPVELGLNQGMYHFEHAEIEDLALFLTPIRPDPDKRYYECVLN